MITHKKEERSGKTTTTLNTNSKLIKNSIYVNHMSTWLKLFPRTDLHIVDGDNLRENPVHELRQVERFLGLRKGIKETQFYFNKTRGFYCYHKSATQSECLKRDKGIQHPEIDRGLLQQLHSFFKPYNERFYSIVGQKFNWD